MSLHQIKKIMAKRDGKNTSKTRKKERKKTRNEMRCDFLIQHRRWSDDWIFKLLSYYHGFAYVLMIQHVLRCAFEHMPFEMPPRFFFLSLSVVDYNNANKTTRTKTEQQWNWACTEIMVPIHFVLLQKCTTRCVFLLLYISYDYKKQAKYSTLHRKRLWFECISFWVTL